jgi:hypothetical protein
MTHLGNSIFVVAIDIGTTYSGYAFASKQDYHYSRDPRAYITSGWEGSNFFSLEARTTVLLDENKTFVAFGYKAENLVSDLVSENEHKAYF